MTGHLNQIPGQDQGHELNSSPVVMSSNNTTDTDGDGLADANDDCPNGTSNWTSSSATDYDSDGCQDANEDLDDDNDGVVDAFDTCPQGDLNWISTNATDADGDGCQDTTEDDDGGGNTGGNNTGGNNTTCGTDPASSLVSIPTIDNHPFSDQTDFYAHMITSCAVLNSTNLLTWQIFDLDNNSVLVTNGEFNWSANAISEYHNFTVSNWYPHSQSNYSLLATWSMWNTNTSAWEFLDSDSQNFTCANCANNTGGSTNPCGNDVNYSSLFVSAYQMMMPMLYEGESFVGTYNPSCALKNMNHSFMGHLQGPNASDYASFSWDMYMPTGPSAIAMQQETWASLGVGTYSFYVEWNLNQSGTYTFVDEGWYNFTVISNTSTSPGSSQSDPLMPFNCTGINWNSTGFTLQDCQNNQDAFWFVFNNTGGTFWIDPVVAIGYDYVVLSGPNITSVTLPTGYGDDVYNLYMWNGSGWYETNIVIEGGETYNFTENWSTQSAVDRFSIRGIEASEEVDPNDANAFVTGLNFANTNEVMMTMTPVTVNYTSNNTGGNNSGCPGLSLSGIDGVIDFENVSSAYAQGDTVNAWVDLCWSPYLSNTSMWFSVWLNDSNGMTIQEWGLQGSTWFPAWEQGIDYGEGHWVFPLRHLPVSGAWNLSIDSLAPGETYCFEGNLKVFDTTIGVFVWVDDATPMCFSSPQNNNTGGDNTGGNNTGGNNTGGNNTIDTDYDGVIDMLDNCPEIGNPSQSDYDQDGFGDGCDTDIDGDGMANENDAFPNDPSEQSDIDADGVGDNSDADDDGDGIADGSDNCPIIANSDQADLDGNGVGTACDSLEITVGENGTISDDGDSIPALSMIGTAAAISVGFFFATRREDDE